MNRNPSQHLLPDTLNRLACLMFPDQPEPLTLAGSLFVTLVEMIAIAAFVLSVVFWTVVLFT